MVHQVRPCANSVCVCVCVCGQGTDASYGKLIRQQVGIPMGGKASSEIANLFCYSVESDFIDRLWAAGKVEEAKLCSLTWRYIDHLLGFGERRWEELDYAMEHKDTSRQLNNEVVFLGMKVRRYERGLWTEVWPKGEGWSWQPNKYLDYTSCHTPWTKRYLLKSLPVRAATICNSDFGFKKPVAVEYYTRGLIVRGCPKSAVNHSWQSFCQMSTAFTGQPFRRTALTKWFNTMVEAAFAEFASVAPRKSLSSMDRATASKQQLLLCGMHAVNAVLEVMQRPPLNKAQMDTINENVVVEEALLLENGSAQETAVQAAGNYSVEVVTAAQWGLRGLQR